ncbi:hypothetical protein PAK_P100085 [Pseudomonas phage PAK_P1]|uniref:Uncharacterized protein n=1 Tax=Pseudomonas phage PAK_P1 TaxID=743813 RepID=D4N4B1_9CAUD|nr:hypothetical protein PAK_P100085 [Pseudomonas phage PAK_P1]ADD65081.1 hypothetical protein PAK_P100085 [Pseudomonas phage PAK_P1]
MDMFDKYMQVMYDRDLNAKKVEKLEAKLLAAVGLLQEARGFVDCDNPLNESAQIKLLEEIDEFLSSPVAQHSVPEGWMLVPVEPLLNMMSDKDHDTRITAERQLLSILGAAPGKGD